MKKKLINTKKYLPVALCSGRVRCCRHRSGAGPVVQSADPPRQDWSSAVQLWTECTDQTAGCSSEWARRFRHDSVGSFRFRDRAVWSRGAGPVRH